jgi:hypothetical protein
MTRRYSFPKKVRQSDYILTKQRTDGKWQIYYVEVQDADNGKYTQRAIEHPLPGQVFLSKHTARDEEFHIQDALTKRQNDDLHKEYSRKEKSGELERERRQQRKEAGIDKRTYTYRVYTYNRKKEELSHTWGLAGRKGVQQYKQGTHKRFPHKWVKFTIYNASRDRYVK